MPRLDKANVEVRGHKDDVIAMTLNYFSIRSGTARTLLQRAAANNLVITLTNNNSDVETRSKTDVQGDWVACHQDQQELTESLLFETKNSVNWDRQHGLDERFGAIGENKLSYLEYGTEKALIESESSVAINQILSEVRAGYVPSEWGCRQMASVATGTARPEGFAVFFANAKHEESDTSTKMGLKSKYLYAYEKIEQYPGSVLSNKTRFLNCSRQILTPARQDIMTGPVNGGKRTDLFRKLDLIFDDADPKQKVRHAFACYILGLRFLVERRGWFVSWRGNTGVDYYEFAREIRRVDGFPGENGEEVARLFQGTFG